jgi:hypothetical protein
MQVSQHTCRRPVPWAAPIIQQSNTNTCRPHHAAVPSVVCVQCTSWHTRNVGYLLSQCTPPTNSLLPHLWLPDALPWSHKVTPGSHAHRDPCLFTTPANPTPLSPRAPTHVGKGRQHIRHLVGDGQRDAAAAGAAHEAHLAPVVDGHAVGGGAGLCHPVDLLELDGLQVARQPGKLPVPGKGGRGGGGVGAGHRREGEA